MPGREGAAPPPPSAAPGGRCIRLLLRAGCACERQHGDATGATAAKPARHLGSHCNTDFFSALSILQRVYAGSGGSGRLPRSNTAKGQGLSDATAGWLSIGAAKIPLNSQPS
jgi:hypothetical protein